MQRLDNVKDKMNEGDYLRRCNKLRDVYSYWTIEKSFERKWDYFLLPKKVLINYRDHLNKQHSFAFEIK